MRGRLKGGAYGCLLLLWIFAFGATQAEEGIKNYPAKAVKVVIGYPPGGSDATARLVTQRLSEKLGQPFVIDYRPGAAATLGTDWVAKSPADGYTLLFASGTFTISSAMNAKLPYDILKDFAPIAFVGVVPMVLSTHPSLPVHSVKEFIAFARARPGQLDYSTTGAGGGYHLSTLVFASQHGLKFNHVPYKGSSPALIALMGGEVHFMLPNLVTLLPYLGSGRLRALGIASESRSTLAPQLPTIAESGVMPLREGTWYGFLAPSATPRAVVNFLNQEIMQALQTREVHENLTKLGVFIASQDSPENFSAFIRADKKKWQRLMKLTGFSSIE